MKASKQEVEKIVLSVITAMAVIYGYFAVLLGPLQTRQESTRKRAEALLPEITKAKGTIAKTQAIEKHAPAATAMVATLKARDPVGAPIAWFPPRLADFFKERGVEKIGTRFIAESVEKDLPEFRRTTWSLEGMKVAYPAFATALAELENEEPLLEVTSLVMEANAENPEYQHVTISLSNLVNQ